MRHFVVAQGLEYLRAIARVPTVYLGPDTFWVQRPWCICPPIF